MSYSNDFIHCLCGNKFHVSLEDELHSEVDKNDSLEETEEHECEDCGRIYSLTVRVECDVYTTFTDIKYSGREYEDVEGNIFNAESFLDLQIGDSVPLEAGEYEHDDKVYEVEEQKLTNIYNAITDENQLSLL